MDNEAIVSAEELLCAGISEHSGARLVSLDAQFDDFESMYGTYSGEHKEWIHYTRNFVDSWIDASNHDWKYHEPITRDDWTEIAKQILESMRQRKEFAPVVLNGKQIKEF